MAYFREEFKLHTRIARCTPDWPTPAPRNAAPIKHERRLVGQELNEVEIVPAMTNAIAPNNRVVLRLARSRSVERATETDR